MRTDLANRTHCFAGHPFDEANTYWTPRRARECRACRNIRHRQMYERRAISLGRRYRPRRPLPILDRLPKKSPIYERLSELN